MKIAKIMMLASLAIFTFISCKKDDEPKSFALEGKWVGTYVNQASGNSFFFSLNIKPGGIIEELNQAGQKTGEGTWEIEHDILTAHYKMVAPNSQGYSIIAAFYKNNGKLLGDWGYDESATDGGTFQLSKQ